MNENDNEIIQGNESAGNILVVDDNSKNLQIISMALSKYGYKVAVANSGLSGLKYLERKLPDLILLDIMMPEMDGYELCKIIKSNPEYKHIPVIFLTAKSDLKDLIEGFNIGAVDYLLKPFRNEELSVRVSTHIQLKKAKETIEQKNAELEILNQKLIDNQNRIVRDAQSLAFLNEKLVDSENVLKDTIATKDKFYSIIAHDLKGPFSSLIGLSEVLSQDSHQLSGEETAELNDTIYNLALTVYQLLDELLQWSQSQLGEMKFRASKENVFELCEKAIIQFDKTAALKGISINNYINANLVMNVDKNMISAIFRNLIGNAIKFTNHNGGDITLKSIVFSDEVEFTVSDSGIGMTEEAVEKLLKFDSKDSTNGTDGELGTGLGLLLVKEFVEMHGGKIKVLSELNKGTKISFTIKT